VSSAVPLLCGYEVFFNCKLRSVLEICSTMVMSLCHQNLVLFSLERVTVKNPYIAGEYF